MSVKRTAVICGNFEVWQAHVKELESRHKEKPLNKVHQRVAMFTDREYIAILRIEEARGLVFDDYEVVRSLGGPTYDLIHFVKTRVR